MAWLCVRDGGSYPSATPDHREAMLSPVWGNGLEGEVAVAESGPWASGNNL